MIFVGNSGRRDYIYGMEPRAKKYFSIAVIAAVAAVIGLAVYYSPGMVKAREVEESWSKLPALVDDVRDDYPGRAEEEALRVHLGKILDRDPASWEVKDWVHHIKKATPDQADAMLELLTLTSSLRHA